MMKASAMNLTAPLVAWSEDTMSPESPSTLNTKVNKTLPKARRTREFSAFAKVIARKQLQKAMVIQGMTKKINMSPNCENADIELFLSC